MQQGYFFRPHRRRVFFPRPGRREGQLGSFCWCRLLSVCRGSRLFFRHSAMLLSPRGICAIGWACVCVCPPPVAPPGRHGEAASRGGPTRRPQPAHVSSPRQHRTSLARRRGAEKKERRRIESGICDGRRGRRCCRPVCRPITFLPWRRPLSHTLPSRSHSLSFSSPSPAVTFTPGCSRRAVRLSTRVQAGSACRVGSQGSSMRACRAGRPTPAPAGARRRCWPAQWSPLGARST